MNILNIGFLVAVILLLISGAVAYTGLSVNNDLILHFTQAGEPDYIGSQADVLRVIGIGGLIALVNYLLARFLIAKERFFALSLVTTGIAVSLLLLVAVSVIVINNQ